MTHIIMNRVRMKILLYNEKLIILLSIYTFNGGNEKRGLKYA